ncbi:hypothetical protein [Enterococcus lemanii]|jgi:hypothetical protein|uniref:Uncharacterized protein n=1 Tax=Enterococcus lemanii TaxID=1159752 RepID=A0ABV9MTQ8_9ENTE|nr:hypothetical protein [Enterococcus lemanii]MBM7709338.1 hypothetical protein [Enterococcus lemanii]NLM68000.1 hypothetical protein [Enterococcus sp.]
MDPLTRLDHLSPKIRIALSSDFIFLVFPDKVQHFPARNFGPKETKQALHERLGQNYKLTTWQGCVVAYSAVPEIIAILPRFNKIAELQDL